MNYREASFRGANYREASFRGALSKIIPQSQESRSSIPKFYNCLR